MKAISITCLLLGLTTAAHAGAQCSKAASEFKAVAQALSMEDTNQAEDRLDALESQLPDCPEIALDRARSLYLRGQSARAQEALLHYTQVVPEDARGYAYLGEVLLDRRNGPDADAASLKALEQNPLEPAALALRGRVLSIGGHLDEGTALLEHACQLDPADAEAHFQLGASYVKLKRRGEAEAEFEKSLALVPQNASAWDYLALDLEPLGEIDKAEEAYRKAEAVNHPGRHYDGFLDYNYGRFLARRNQLGDAKKHLDLAVDRTPDVRAVWYERARVNLSLKDYLAARGDAEKALSLPDRAGVILDLQMYALLQQIYSRVGETVLADKYADLSRKSAVPVQQNP